MKYRISSNVTKPNRSIGNITENERHDIAPENRDLPGTLNFWCKMRYWTPREAAALVMEIDPDKITNDTSESPKFKLIRRLISRISANEHPSPSFVLIRLEKLGINVPEYLMAECLNNKKSYQLKVMTNSELQEKVEELEEKLRTFEDYSNGKEKKSVMMIAYAALKLKYGSTLAGNARAYSDVERKIEDLGFKMKTRTVDKWMEAIIEYCRDGDA